jgi:hypothetical protein
MVARGDGGTGGLAMGGWMAGRLQKKKKKDRQTFCLPAVPHQPFGIVYAFGMPRLFLQDKTSSGAFSALFSSSPPVVVPKSSRRYNAIFILYWQQGGRAVT